MIVILPTFWHSAPAWDFSWQLTRNVSLATMLVHSYRRSLDEGYGQASVHCELKRRGLRSQQTCGHFPPGAPVTSFLSQQTSTVIRSPRFQQDDTSWAPLLDRRRNESHQTYSSYQLVASGNSHNAVSRHLDKNRAKHRRTVFSMKKAQKSKQRSTNWRRRHLGDMQQQPRRWPGFDKCVETKFRWDVYIRPWPPGWSFWRRIYTSRGSERVKGNLNYATFTRRSWLVGYAGAHHTPISWASS